MGIYLNGRSAYGLFQEDVSSAYYVDKTDILDDLVHLIELKKKRSGQREAQRGKGPKYVAITRPRRFGKTMMANMIASYFGKGIDSHEEFDRLKASRYSWYKKHLNQHNVIHMIFNKIPLGCSSYSQYICRFANGLLTDLRRAYPEAGIEKDEDLWDALTKVYEYCDGEKFIFVLDEWDYIYHQDFATQEDKAGVGYVDFIFYPYVKSEDAIILELKVNHTADEAIRQIKERQYALRFEGKFGENPEYTGRILAVGIAYHKDDAKKRHECKVEVLRERI